MRFHPRILFSVCSHDFPAPFVREYFSIVAKSNQCSCFSVPDGFRVVLCPVWKSHDKYRRRNLFSYVRIVSVFLWRSIESERFFIQLKRHKRTRSIHNCEVLTNVPSATFRMRDAAVLPNFFRLFFLRRTLSRLVRAFSCKRALSLQHYTPIHPFFPTAGISR